MGCLCALTFIVSLGLSHFTIHDVYGLPLHCVQGTFHYDQHEESLVFQRHSLNTEVRVSIPLPQPNIQGTFSVWYCWGQYTAIVGNEEVGVVIQVIEKGLA